MDGRWVRLEQLLDRFDHLRSFTAPTDPNRQVESAVLIDHVEKLDYTPIHGLVELELYGPDFVGIFGPQQFLFAIGKL